MALVIETVVNVYAPDGQCLIEVARRETSVNPAPSVEPGGSPGAWMAEAETAKATIHRLAEDAGATAAERVDQWAEAATR